MSLFFSISEEFGFFSIKSLPQAFYIGYEKTPS
jgi:hypothetical protein